MAREIQAHAAPAAADVQRLQPRSVEGQLGGDMALLGELRLVEPGAGPVEIGAGILPVDVEEQVVELRRQIVVVLDVPPRALRRVVLDNPAIDQPQPGDRPHPRLVLGLVAGVAEDQRQHVEDRALGDVDAAIHVGFAEFQAGIDRHAAFGGGRVEAQMDRITGAVAPAGHAAVTVGHGEIAENEKMLQIRREYAVHVTTPASA